MCLKRNFLKEKKYQLILEKHYRGKYLCFVRANPINWKTPTEILYAEHDNLTSRQTVDKFIDRHCANLTVMNDGEHWFHTDEQIFFRDNWLRKVIQ